MSYNVKLLLDLLLTKQQREMFNRNRKRVITDSSDSDSQGPGKRANVFERIKLRETGLAKLVDF